MFTNIRHTGIVVKNIKKMLAFYILLGFQKQEEFIANKNFISKILKSNETELKVIKLRLNNQGLELLKYKYNKSLSKNKYIWNYGITHIALEIDNIDNFYNIFKNKIKFLSKPILNPEKTAKVCFCRDPEGNYIEIVELL